MPPSDSAVKNGRASRFTQGTEQKHVFAEQSNRLYDEDWACIQIGFEGIAVIRQHPRQSVRRSADESTHMSFLPQILTQRKTY